MDPHLGPDRLGDRVAHRPTPVFGVGLDEEQSPARRLVDGLRRRADRQALGAGVGHLDTEGVRQEEQNEAEVTAGEPTVADGVGREFGGDESDGSGRVGVVREARPLGELLDGELTDQTGAASGAAEPQGQVVSWGGNAGRLRLVGELMLCHGARLGRQVIG